MYHFKYKLIKNNEGVKTSLYAKFRFENEVAPKYRKEIRDRIGCSYRTKKDSLLYYLINNEGFNFEDWQNMEKDGKMLFIERCLVKLGFSIKITSYSEKSLERILNLDRLNNFVLTGKVDN